MIFKNEKDEDIDVNHSNFKQILRGGILGIELSQVELQDGTIVWLKAADAAILNAAGYHQ